jgi:outer membrane protein assembly factor BamA
MSHPAHRPLALALALLAFVVFLPAPSRAYEIAGALAVPDPGPSWGQWGQEKKGRDEGRFDAGLRGDFQRVDGLVLGFDQELRSRGQHGARVHLSEAYAFHRERWLYEAALERPLLPRGFLVLGAGLFRRTQPFDGLDQRIVTDGENALAALLVKEDYRDYYEEEGGEVFLRQPLGRRSSIQAGYVRTSHDPLINHTRSSLTRWGEDFRPNPAASAGELRAFRLRLERDTRRGKPATAGGQWHRLEWERADGGLGGDFAYSRLLADLRHYVKLSPGQVLGWRLLYGTTLAGRLPPQKEFALGGLSTLRAHEFKELAGDQALLGNVEYRFDLSDEFQTLAFVDVGATARGQGHLDDQRFALDGGFGFGTRNGRATVAVARDLHETDAPFKVSFRLGSAF